MSGEFNSAGAVLTGAKQTMAAWSKVLETREEVPDIYQGCLETWLAYNRQFPYTLLVPSLVKPQGRTTEKLVCDGGDAIHIFERSGDQVVAKIYPYQSVYTVEAGSILLNSWLTINGMTDSGAAEFSTIDFNTASARHFTVFMNKLRPALHGADEAQLRVEKDKFDYLSTLNFKFMNYGRSSLVGGDIVRQILLQPEIREPIWALLGGLFQKVVSPAHLTILTNRELILIQDIPSGKKMQKANYGGIWQYIRLSSVQSVTWAEAENQRLTFSIMVSPDKKIERLFALSSKDELEHLCAHF
jgi:hypothetical protein